MASPHPEIESSSRLPAGAKPWSFGAWTALLLTLTLATLLLHGFHPFAEDGGLYAAGVEYTLDRSLFPHFTVFVTGHLRFSLFAPAVALLVRLTRLSLPAALLLLDFLTALTTLAAARSLLRRCTRDARAQLAGLALLAAGWTLPIAGTSLYLMDPYVTARSVSMPLSLWAAAFALDAWPSLPLFPGFAKHPGLRCAACLLLAAVFHPLMAVYAFLFVAALRATQSAKPVAAWILLASTVLLSCLALQKLAPAESSAENAAIVTRYYWFLSKWQWYERLGLLGPLAMLALVLRGSAATAPAALSRSSPSPALSTEGRVVAAAWERALSSRPSRTHPGNVTLARAAILLGLLVTACALLFAHESAVTHGVARLQPLRAFLLIYAVMLLLLGATLHDACARAASRSQIAGSAVRPALRRALPWLATVAMAAGMFLAARATYPGSPHMELPWQAGRPGNPWVQAFLWARLHTPPDALFALDARYVNAAGEDAQTFRAISLRSALPDYSKDGGEASITPSLAPAWLAGAEAQKDLSELPDAQRDRRLQPFGVTWMVLRAEASTAHPCPYQNRTVKVCRR